MKARRMPLWLGWTLALLVAAGFAWLGFWQMDRAQQKREMLARVQRVLIEKRESPLRDPDRNARGYDWAKVVGTFTDAPAILLDNQQFDDQPGVRAYRLFQERTGGGAAGLEWLVDLGWLPLPGDRELPVIEKPQGEWHLRGLLSPPPSRGLLAGVATKQAGDQILTTSMDASDLPALLGVAKLPPRVLRLDPAMKDIGYARDLDVLPNTPPPSRHLGYAVQWFALSIAVLATAAVLTFRKHRA